VIFDRTQEDVDTAAFLRSEKVQKFQPLSDAEIETLEKGTLTISTLNRIEQKQKELMDILVSVGFSFFDVETKNWTEKNVFDSSDFKRIIDNLDVFKSVVTVMNSTPKTPKYEYYFENINDIEKILYDIEVLIENMKRNTNFSWAIGISDVGLNFMS
jgi:hypothetical protein